MKILITGGAGFIGSALIRYIINNTNFDVINVDKLTYAGNLESLFSVENNKRYIFEHIDICNSEGIKNVLNKYEPDKVIHLAAESHVDRSIDGPDDFIQTNIVGTFVLLEEVKSFWLKLNKNKKDNFKFHHVSTDEVYGDLEYNKNLFTEKTSYNPSSPYAASKASSDHLVRAWHRTFGLPILITNCSNNYGPYQYPEKLIPLTILNAINGKSLPVYGNGKQVRDWLYVDDHARALVDVVLHGESGETYNIGGRNEFQNIDVVRIICNILDELFPSTHEGITKYEQLICFTQDRAGHDKRYAIDSSKISNKLNWTPSETFSTGIKKTVQWYLNNLQWCKSIKNYNNQNQKLGIKKR